MSKASYTLYYAGEALANGQMSVRDLAPALLAFGNLCDEANHELNGNVAKVDVKIRAFAPGSFGVEIIVGVAGAAGIVATLFREPIKTAREVVGLVSDSVDLVKRLRGESVTDETSIANGVTQITVEHKHTHDVADRVYNFLKRPSVQKDLRDLTAPLRNDGIDRLTLLQEQEVVEEVTSEEVIFFETLPESALLALEEPAETTTSTTEAWYTVITVSSNPKNRWRLRSGDTEISVLVEDHDLHLKAKEGNLGIEPGFVVKVRIRSLMCFEHGEPKTQNTLEAVLEVKQPQQRRHHPLI